MKDKRPRSKPRKKRKKNQPVVRSKKAAPRSRSQGAVPMRMEIHHVDGRRNNRHLTIAISPSCHSMVHKRAREAGVDLSKTLPTLLHRLEKFQRMRGSLYIELGHEMCREGNEIENLISALDEEYPNWRHMSEAE
jgi:hypothetical protein